MGAAGHRGTHRVATIMDEEWSSTVTTAHQHSHILLEIGSRSTHGLTQIIRAHAPQMGRSLEEKDNFYKELQSLLQVAPHHN
eukprot:9931985-Prorocentrum_lima.AAC.1